MASSGSINLTLESVDLTPACGVCYELNPSCGWGRGALTYTAPFSWSVNDSGVLSVSFNGGSTRWWVASSTDAYYLKVQFSTDGSNWTDVLSSSEWHNQQIYVNTLISNLTSNLGTTTLTQSGYIRIYSYTGSACPTSDAQNAYPTEAASQAVTVPVYVDVNWTATLKYNANGGSGAPGNQTHTQTGNSYTFTISSTRPTRTNYRFEGWATSSSATTAQYQPGGSYTIQKSSPTKTLYAVWKKYYRPGKIWDGTAWVSHDRDPGGAAKVKASSAWNEMRTIDAPTGKDDPPTIYHDSDWYNMRNIGTQ